MFYFIYYREMAIEVFNVKNALTYNMFYRCTVIVWMVVKFISQIYFFHLFHGIWDEQTKRKWEHLLHKQAVEYRKKAVKMGGVLIKVGQFLSTRTDFMPEVFIKELSGLVDRVPPMPYSYASRLLKEEWGAEPDEYLEDINKASIASASIGEVYYARLKGSGKEVAIKVQRYQVEKIFHMDFKALRVVFWIISFFTSFGKKADLKSLYLELIRVMDRELDFTQELHYGKYFKERFKGDKTVYIPAFMEELCTKRVLVMEWAEGAKINDLEFMRKHHIQPERIAKNLFNFYSEQFLNPGNFHADPHAGNLLINKNGTITILDFGMVGEVKKQDTTYFKHLIQGVIIDDYDRVIEALEQMNFVLPNADTNKLKKMVKQLIEMYRDGSFKNMDGQLLEQIKQDIKLFVKEQPIQLSAEYAYLGRAISINIGILFAIYPETDIEKWAKPKIKKWLGSKTLIESIYKQYAKESIEPIFSIPKAMLGWLENGEKDREWDKEKQEKTWKHHFFLVLESFHFVMILVSIAASWYGYVEGYTIFGSFGLAGITYFVIMFTILARKHYKVIQSIK